MTIEQYISRQEPERQGLLSEIHSEIVKADKTVSAQVDKMMGKDMIIYNAPGTFKYGLSSVKKHISLHLLPIYGVPALHSKYSALMPRASFQKGCINFTSAEEVPMDILKSLLADCAKIENKRMRPALLLPLLFCLTLSACHSGSGSSGELKKIDLNQVELMKKFVGRWTCELGNDTVLIGENVAFGTG
jgi:uncharacterized protein YdhG (YjbR/CyaY superfamily)